MRKSSKNTIQDINLRFYFFFIIKRAQLFVYNYIVILFYINLCLTTIFEFWVVKPGVSGIRVLIYTYKVGFSYIFYILISAIPII
jgi:hypothetical protein